MKKILINGQYADDKRVAIVDQNGKLQDIIFDRATIHSHNQDAIQGGIYLAKVKSVKPNLQAVFIEYSPGKTGFLPFSHISPEYYKLHKNKTGAQLPSFPVLNIHPLDLQSANDAIDLTDIDQSEDSIAVDRIDNTTDDTALDNKSTNDIEQQLLSAEDENIFDLADAKTRAQKSDENTKQVRIQDVISKDQWILVQAYKEPKGDKAYMFSTYISLVGRYVILLPNQKEQLGVSRRINPATERNRIKQIVTDILQPHIHTSGLIARTASLAKSEAMLKADYNYCARLWNKIVETANAQVGKNLTFIYQGEGFIDKVLRDFWDHRVSEIVVDDAEIYNEVVAFVSDINRDEVHKIKRHISSIPIFSQYDIESEIINLYKPTVMLPSGGYLVIHLTEALIAIDVNSGRSNTENNLEDTAFKINEEAAKEVLRQIKLRNLSGLIVIDFIDMQELKHKKHIEALVKKELALDKARTQVSEIDQFGVMEISRQRVSMSFSEIHCITCDKCLGGSVVRNKESDAFLMLRTLEAELYRFKNNLQDSAGENKSAEQDDNLTSNNIVDTGSNTQDTTVQNINKVRFIAKPDRICALFNKVKHHISHIERVYDTNIELVPDPSLAGEGFIIEHVLVPKKINRDAVLRQDSIQREVYSFGGPINEEDMSHIVRNLASEHNSQAIDAKLHRPNSNSLNNFTQQKSSIRVATKKFISKIVGFIKNFW